MMVMDFLGPSITESSGLEKLTITSAFTTVLTSAYTPTYGQISCINPDYLVFLHGGDNTAANSRAATVNTSGALQATREFEISGNVIGSLKACAADNESTYIIGVSTGASEIIIGSFSHDLSTANWGRKLNYGQPVEEEVDIAVSDGFVYFTVKCNNIDTVVGQLDASTGVLQWDKSLGGNTGPIGIKADSDGCYVAWPNPNGLGYFGVIALDNTGTKRWQKVTSAFTSALGFDINDTHLFYGGIDSVDPTTITVLKLDLEDGSLSAQVRIDRDSTATVLAGLSNTRMPLNWLAAGGGKVIVGFLVPATPHQPYFAIMDEDFNVETDLLSLSTNAGSDNTLPTCLVVDGQGNWLITGYRDDGVNDDHFISGVLEDGTVTPATSNGWMTATRVVANPSYTVSNGSNSLVDLTPSTNTSETITISSPSNLSTEAW